MKNLDNNAAVVDYLLGYASEQEADRIDELCFTDEETRETVDAAEADLIDKYVRGELSGQKLERFRSRFLAVPSRRKKVEFARALTEFVDKKSEPAAYKSAYSWIADLIHAVRRPAFALATAAAFLLVLSGGIWWLVDRAQLPADEIAKVDDADKYDIGKVNSSVRNDQLASVETNRTIENNAPSATLPPASNNSQFNASRRIPVPAKPDLAQPAKIATIVLMPLTRGTSEMQTLKISSDANKVSIRARLEFDDYPAYTAALIDPTDGSTVWTSGKLHSRKDKGGSAVNVVVPVKLLRSHIYSLSVTGEQAGGRENVGDYPFRVVR